MLAPYIYRLTQLTSTLIHSIEKDRIKLCAIFAGQVKSYFKKEYNKLREESGISISLKIHYIFDHLEDLLDMTGHGLNTVDDHTVECMHQHYTKECKISIISLRISIVRLMEKRNFILFCT